VQIYRYFTFILCVFCKTAAPIRRFSLDQGHSKSSLEASAFGPPYLLSEKLLPKKMAIGTQVLVAIFLFFRNQLPPANRHQKQ